MSRDGVNVTELVRRTLREEGHIANYDAIYKMGDDEGFPARNTRLAGTIHNLRRKGWDIETTYEDGRLATYVLIAAPDEAPRRPRSEPSARRTSSVPPAKESTALGRGEAEDGLVCSECARRLARADMERRYGWCPEHGMMTGERF